MPDISSTAFGLVIAFVLPGVTAILSVGIWSPRVALLLNDHIVEEPSGVFFLLMLFLALILGLTLTAVRALLFENWLCASERLEPEDFKGMGSDPHLIGSFRGVVEEHYRYHQFWGGMAIVLVPFLVGLIVKFGEPWGVLHKILAVVVFVSIEIVTVWAAIAAFQKYVRRAKHVLGGG